MATTAFTDIYLRKLKPPAEGRIEVYDGKIAGFGLRVSSAGTKTFFVLGRHGRSFKRISLGRYPTLTLEKARARRSMPCATSPTASTPRSSCAPPAVKRPTSFRKRSTGSSSCTACNRTAPVPRTRRSDSS